MNKYNIFWFIVDSVRTFKTGVDDRDRLNIMDALQAEAIEFTNCVTSAPSSLLSAGGIFTGLPGVFIARHFNDWKFKDASFSTIRDVAVDHGYRSFPILDSRELRERLQFLLPPLKRSDLPKNYNLSDYAWHNSEITEIFKFILNNNKEKPGCYTLWYDCRRDPKTSDHVEEAIIEIKKLGLWENSIFIMHSDHGYPDPRTHLDELYFKNIGHDMILTDDNIKVPFLIRYPGMTSPKLVNNQIGLIDVMPTIFDILKIPYKPSGSKYHGNSIVPIIKGEEYGKSRVRRTDTRLPMDVNRMSSLKSDDFKYIYFFNDGTEVMFDLKKDSKETINVIQTVPTDIVNEFRTLLKDYENHLYQFHSKALKTNVQKFINNYSSLSEHKEPISITVLSNAEPALIGILFSLLNELEIHDLQLVSANKRNWELNDHYSVKLIDAITKLQIEELSDIKSAEICIYLTENTKRVFLKSEQKYAAMAIPAKKVYMMNFNFEIFNYFHAKFFNTAFIKLFFDWEIKGYFYKEEPLYFVRDLLFFLRGMFSRILLLMGRKDSNFDLNAAKEAFEFRKYHIEDKTDNDELHEMGEDQFKYEVDRMNTRE